MNDKLKIILSIIMLLAVCAVGWYVGITMVDEMEEYPEITGIGAPPDLRIMTVTILIIAVVCFILMKLNPIKDDDNNEK